MFILPDINKIENYLPHTDSPIIETHCKHMKCPNKQFNSSFLIDISNSKLSTNRHTPEKDNIIYFFTPRETKPFAPLDDV